MPNRMSAARSMRALMHSSQNRHTRMKVFFLCSWFPSRINKGEGMFLRNMAEAIALYSEITVFYINGDVKLSEKGEEVRAIEKGVETIILYYKPFRSGIKQIDTITNSLKEVALMFELVSREYKKGKPDLLHLNIVTPKILVLWFYKFIHKVPFVYSEHWDIPLRVRFGLMKKWLPWRIGMKLSATFASKVIVCSKAMKENFEYYGLSNNVEIISNVIDIAETDFADEARRIGKKVLVHISSLESTQKNVYGLLDAIRQVAASRDDFELHILGKGKELAALKEYTMQQGLLEKVVFYHGFVSDEEKYNWIKRSIAHVIFSNFEGQSVVTVESLRYGRPVIATKCGGPEDFVSETNGILIAPRDVSALVAAINEMLDQYERFDPEAIRKSSEAQFSSKVVGKRHAELYSAIKERN
jgi:L-malate glycosyltransferase